ncbi:MAG: hypothetical protein JNM56_15145 [Planctomycetia bacterium]|nr:hypothetical protein [Planctomycetia bacterium]
MADTRERSRLLFDTDEVVKRAIRMRAGLDGVRMGDVINGALKTYLADELVLLNTRFPEVEALPAKRRHKDTANQDEGRSKQ